ncbi:MAG: tetratricopeptide repeat protein [Sedimentisphaerales bacterium]
MDKTFSKYRELFVYVALSAATLATFWQVGSFEFLNYDDMAYVTRNEHVKEGLSLHNIIWAFTAIRSFNWHPLTWLSHMLDCQLFGLNPAGHHLTNLLLHTANTLLLFAILKRMTKAIWQSVFVAAVFALHPLHVESVAWIAERKDVLSTLFWLLTMAAYTGYVRHPGTSRYLLTVLIFTLGLMAKPMLVTLPFVLLLLDYWPFGRLESVKAAAPGSQKSPQKRVDWYGIYRLVREKIPFFVLSAISSVITFVVQRKEGAVSEIDAIPLMSRLANALVSYINYIGKTAWPTKLAVLYPHPLTNPPSLQIILNLLVLVAASAAVIFLAVRHRYLLTGWFWYLGTLVPVIGLVQVGSQAMADRYTYVPLIGLSIIIAWGLADLLPKLRYREIMIGISMSAVLLTLSMCTHLQLRYWRNSITLFERALEVTEENAVAHYALGYALFEDDKVDKAMGHFKEALRINPSYIDAHNHMGLALMKQDKLKEAIEYFTKALLIKPDYATAHFNLGWALARRGDIERATIQFREALQFKPDYPEAQGALVKALIQQGKFAEAVQLEPNSALIHHQLATALVAVGKFDLAIEHYNEALRLKPDDADAINDLAWFLATRKETKYHNPEKAVQLAEKACKLTGYKQSETLDTLAAAYAAAGRFNEAIETAQSAVRSAASNGKKELAEEIQKRLELYKASQPYRQR